MKWLLDEMLPAAACRELGRRGHDAVSVYDVGLGGAKDDDVFDFAAREERIIVTENVADYALLVEQRLTRNEPCVPVVFVRKSELGRRGGLANRLAKRLHDWSVGHPAPYVGPHWA